MANQRIEHVEAHSNDLDCMIEALKKMIQIKDEDMRSLKEEHA